MIKLSHGSGGKEMRQLVKEIRQLFPNTTTWKNLCDDAASTDAQPGKLLFTTDSYVVSPLFFPGGNIGKIAFCGTFNDLMVMGAKPLGMSLSLVIEEGFPKEELFAILQTIADLSKQFNIPIVTGDTKVMEKGKLDKLIINTSAVGFSDRIIDDPIKPGDEIIVSGPIGEHASALLCERYGFKSNIISDCKPLQEIGYLIHMIKQARDITRGGLSTVLNELAEKNKVSFSIQEEDIPITKEVLSLTNILGIDPYSLACEGRFLCIAPNNKSGLVLDILLGFNQKAAIIGKVTDGKGVILQTKYGKRLLPTPEGNIVPRIC